VAVEEMIVTDGGQPRRIDVPVEVPEGVNRDNVETNVAGGPTGLFTAYSGNTLRTNYSFNRSMAAPVPRSGKPRRGGGGGGGSVGSGGGVGSGSGAGSGGSNAKAASPPKASNAMVLAEADDEVLKVYSPAEQRIADLRAKLHPSLFAVVDRLKNKNPIVSPDEIKFVHDGKADIQIWLTEKSDENLAKLKELGFEVVLDPKSARMVIGRLSIEKLEALADLKFVRYASPQVLHH
jgi:hypothetical protein